MSREVNWLKFRLRGAETAVKAARMNKQVGLAARQALEAAESGLAVALLQWDSPPLTNGEKGWGEIIMEISRKPEVLWHYITALRGPDTVKCAHTAKAIFTCPLRGRCAHALGKEEFAALSLPEIEQSFVITHEHRYELYHYLQHIAAVWEVFHPPLGELLTDVFLRGLVHPPGVGGLKKAARRYAELLEEWMQSKYVIMEEATDE